MRLFIRAYGNHPFDSLPVLLSKYITKDITDSVLRPLPIPWPSLLTSLTGVYNLGKFPAFNRSSLPQ